MKNLILAFLLFFCVTASAQFKVDVIEFQGSVTTTIRDAFDVPTGKAYLIYNVTTGQLEWSEDDDVWHPVDSKLSDAEVAVAATNEGFVTGAHTINTDNQNAAQVSNTPNGGISSTDVQAAVNELDSEKANINGNNFLGANEAFGVSANNDTYISVIDPSGQDPRTRMSGGDGGSANFTQLDVNENGIVAGNLTIAKINALGNSAIPTVEWVNANTSGSTPFGEASNVISPTNLTTARLNIGGTGGFGDINVVNDGNGRMTQINQGEVASLNSDNSPRALILKATAINQVSGSGGNSIWEAFNLSFARTSQEFRATAYQFTDGAVTIEDLSGTGDRNVGVNASGQLIELAGGGLSAENQNRIDNQNKIKPFVKTANFDWSNADVETKTGTVDNGKGSMVVVEDGNSYEGAMEDADVLEDEVIRVSAIGAGSEVVNYFLENENGLFRDLLGNTGNQWTVTAPNVVVGTKSGNIITVQDGVVDTRSFCTADPNNVLSGPTALSDNSCNENTTIPSWTSVGTTSSIVASTDSGVSAIEILSNDTDSNARIEYNATIEVGEVYDFAIRYRVTGGTTAEINFWSGFTATPNIQFNTDGNWHTASGTATANSINAIMNLYVERSGETGTGSVEVEFWDLIKQ